MITEDQSSVVTFLSSPTTYAGAAVERRGQIGKHPAHAQQVAERGGSLVLHGWIDAVAHGHRIAHQQLRLVRQQLGEARVAR